MSIKELDNLVAIGQLKVEAPARAELDGLVGAGRAKLADAGNEKLALQSRFDLAYNAAHALALAALRWHGYRSNNRFAVFQALVHTLGLGVGVTRVLSKAHDQRNLAEYQGHSDVDEQFLAELLNAVAQLEAKVVALGPARET
jgi:hypothetical protein